MSDLNVLRNDAGSHIRSGRIDLVLLDRRTPYISPRSTHDTLSLQVVTRRITSKTSIHSCDLFLANFDTFSIRAWEDIRLDRKLILIFTGVIGLYAVIRVQRLANSVPLYMLTNFDGEMALVKEQHHHHF